LKALVRIGQRILDRSDGPHSQQSGFKALEELIVVALLQIISLTDEEMIQLAFCGDENFTTDLLDLHQKGGSKLPGLVKALRRLGLSPDTLRMPESECFSDDELAMQLL
jgi:hypothetical protein